MWRNETGLNQTKFCFIDQVHPERKFNTDDLENSLKTVDNLCNKISPAKYKKAVLQAKLANLQKVAAQQEKLLAEVNQLQTQRHQVSYNHLLLKANLWKSRKYF